MPPQSQPTGTLLNTQPAPQQLPDPNGAVSLSQPQGQQPISSKLGTALGFATNLLHQHLAATSPKKPSTNDQQNSQNGQKQGDQEAKPEDKTEPKEEPKEDVGKKMSDLELSLTEKLDSIRKELKGDHKREVDALKKQIEDALKDEQ